MGFQCSGAAQAKFTALREKPGHLDAHFLALDQGLLGVLTTSKGVFLPQVTQCWGPPANARDAEDEGLIPGLGRSLE